MPKERLYFANLGRKGRLGNQLFQIAATIGIAERNGMDPVFPIWEHERSFATKLPRAAARDETLPIYREETFSYRPIRLRSSAILDGYFQSERYFRANRDAVRFQFAPSVETREHVERLFRSYQFPDCSLHIRRGDYVANGRYFDLSACCYYEQAMSQLGRETKVLVFSDDPAWCRTRLRDPRMIFAERSSDVVDLFLFSYCCVNIISNSSYSWWGAWLNRHTRPVIFAPQRWFAGELADATQPFRSSPGYSGFHDTADIVPAHWTRFDCEVRTDESHRVIEAK